MKEKLILLGAGGHSKSCIDVILAEGKYEIAGVLDAEDKVGTTILDYPVLGTDDCIDTYIQKGFSFLVTVGQIKSAKVRKKLFNMLVEKKASIATIISPKATISRFAKIGRGSVVMHGVHVNAGAIVGNNVILNTGCIIEHDVVIGDHVHISTQAVVNGDVKVEDECFIGSNAVVAHGKYIKTGSIVGAGSVYIQNFSVPGTYIGNPAKQIRTNDSENANYS